MPGPLGKSGSAATPTAPRGVSIHAESGSDLDSSSPQVNLLAYGWDKERELVVRSYAFWQQKTQQLETRLADAAYDSGRLRLEVERLQPGL